MKVKQALFRERGELQNIETEFEVHTHSFVSGQRSESGYGKDGKWHVCGEKISHSHPGGSAPHTHPNTGPSYYGHRKPKVTAKPTGEQFETIPRSDEENTFDLVITDSAKLGGVTPIGDTPIENISMFAAEVMKGAFRLKCIVRDERKRSGRSGA